MLCPSLYRAPWKARPEVPLYPAFLMGALFAYGYPSDTFVKLPVSECQSDDTLALTPSVHVVFPRNVGKVIMCFVEHKSIFLSFFFYETAGMGQRSCVY